MTWEEFKMEVDRQIEAGNIPEDLEISYIDTSACEGEVNAGIDWRGDKEYLAIS